MRRATSIVAPSLNANGASRSLLSSVSATSARLRAGRLAEPPKMTSSISPARSRRAEVSPMTQRSASTRLDLPQPFGPTMPVSPGSIASSVGSTKDLKPARRRRSTCITARGAPLRFGGEAGQRRVKAFDARLALEFLAVQEEGRGRFDAEVVGRDKAALHQRVLVLLVADAGVEILFADAAEQRRAAQRRLPILGAHPFVLRLEQRIGKRKVF